MKHIFEHAKCQFTLLSYFLLDANANTHYYTHNTHLHTLAHAHPIFLFLSYVHSTSHSVSRSIMEHSKLIEM